MILENGTVVGIQWQRAGRYDFDDFLIKNNPARNGSSLLVRKSCFADVGGFDESIRSAADLEMWLRIAESSKTPVLWASRHFLVDLRLRPGSVTRDRLARDMSVEQLLESQTPRLQHSRAELAYVRPAVAALKYGANDDIAERLAAKARSAGINELMRSVAGLQLLFWYTLPRSGRRTVRATQYYTREAVKTANLRLRSSRTA
jgi:hypothetical protein